MDAQAPRRSDARAVAAEALTRLRGDLERMVRRRFASLDAGDVYQRAAIRVLERCDELRDLDHVDGWIRRVVITSALDVLRERKNVEIPTAEPPEMATAEPDDVCACSLSLLDELPEAYSDILRRVDIDGADLGDVADTLHLAKGNAAVRLHRARRALRGRLLDHCGVASMKQCLSCACSERGCCAT